MENARRAVPRATMYTTAKQTTLTLLDALGAFRLGRHLCRGRLIALTYHRVLPDPATPQDPPNNAVFASAFDRHVAYLVRHHHVVTGQDLRAFLEAGVALPKRSALITFDDGYRDNFEHAFPILQRHGASAVFFIASDFIDRKSPRLWFDRLDWALGAHADRVLEWARRSQLSDQVGTADGFRRWMKYCSPDRRQQIMTALEALLPTSAAEEPKGFDPMTWPQVREMARAGMTIGGHTASHQILGAARADQVERELRTCRRRIEQELQQPCWCFSYPNGESSDFRDLDKQALRRAGFIAAFTQQPGLSHTRSDKFALPRMPMPASSDFRVFLSRVTGVHGGVAIGRA